LIYEYQTQKLAGRQEYQDEEDEEKTIVLD
jgi:hypothetical protein